MSITTAVSEFTDAELTAIADNVALRASGYASEISTDGTADGLLEVIGRLDGCAEVVRWARTGGRGPLTTLGISALMTERQTERDLLAKSIDDGDSIEDIAANHRYVHLFGRAIVAAIRGDA
jgi:hypothetical protein